MNHLDTPKPPQQDKPRQDKPRQDKVVLPRLLDIAGVAEHLGTTERHVRGLIAERRIPYVKVGAFVRFDPAELAAWLEHRRVRATSG